MANSTLLRPVACTVAWYSPPWPSNKHRGSPTRLRNTRSKWWAACLTEENAAGVVEQVEGAFAQCGGNTDEEAGPVYEGSTTCPEGYECVEVSSWYSNCQPAAE